MASESKTAVYAALIGNALIAVTKFGGAAVTGSSAMISEAVHSTVDTGNQLLLLLGMSRSRRPADSEHPFGHGKELFFWSLIVAVLIFGVGGGISAYEGILHIRNPTPLEDPYWNYIVLGFAFVFEGASLAVALHSFSKQKGELSFWNAFRRSKDPSTYTVVLEDSAALTGVIVAACGVFASHALNMPVLDGVASIIIGLLLAAVASVLVYEAHGLLIGEAVDTATAEEIRRIATEQPEVEAAAQPLTMYLGPDEVLLNLNLKFNSETSAADIAVAIGELEERIRERFPAIRQIFIEAGGIRSLRHAGREL